MNPGPVEEAGKVASSFVDSLKSQPLSLALVVMNMCLLFIFYFILTTIAATRQREIDWLYKEHKEVREMLAKCVVPPERRSELAKPLEDVVPLPKPKPEE